MNFIVKLPKLHGYDSIWVVCDCLTCAVHFVLTVKTITVPELTYLFLDHIFCYHGIPESIISDRGFVFALKFWCKFMLLIDVKLLITLKLMA